MNIVLRFLSKNAIVLNHPRGIIPHEGGEKLLIPQDALFRIKSCGIIRGDTLFRAGLSGGIPFWGDTISHDTGNMGL